MIYWDCDVWEVLNIFLYEKIYWLIVFDECDCLDGIVIICDFLFVVILLELWVLLDWIRLVDMLMNGMEFFDWLYFLDGLGVEWCLINFIN